MNRLAITRVSIDEKSNKKHLAYIMLDEKRDFVDFQVFQEENSLLNGIFVARVENIVPNIQAAFVRISPKQMAYLSLEDLKAPLYVKKQSELKPLSIGDEIVVQVIKDGLKTKDPVVSTKLTISGSFCVLTTDNVSLGVSKKLSKEQQETYGNLLHTHFEEASKEHGFGLIIRTNAVEASEEDLLLDIKETVDVFLKLKEKSKFQTAFAVLYQAEKPYIQKLKTADLSALDTIYTEEPDIYEEIQEKLPYLVAKNLIKLYKDSRVNLSTLYNFRGSLDKLVDKRVWLDSGANIIIEQLETMTVIDVNSGKNISKDEKAILNINLEATKEILRQLRLRNISGMIIIDYINMKSEEHMDALVSALKEQTKSDPVPCSFIDVTKLGLVELTRKKIHKSLKEILK